MRIPVKVAPLAPYSYSTGPIAVGIKLGIYIYIGPPSTMVSRLMNHHIACGHNLQEVHPCAGRFTCAISPIVPRGLNCATELTAGCVITVLIIPTTAPLIFHLRGNFDVDWCRLIVGKLMCRDILISYSAAIYYRQARCCTHLRRIPCFCRGPPVGALDDFETISAVAEKHFRIPRFPGIQPRDSNPSV